MPTASGRAAEARTETGPLVVLLGPSGAGKDTLISYAVRELSRSPDVLFVRRAITRPADAGSEDHIAMAAEEFDAAIDDGRFSLTWAANGLRYGLPRSIEAHLAEGKVAVVNGSRGAWNVIRKVFPSAVAVDTVAASLLTLAVPPSPTPKTSVTTTSVTSTAIAR